ncbi:cytochrome P450 4C1-like [Trichoplusia ni]|uniref:Cytochrome P450 4C1-like n=1 Tax=Trichoplusia ni TaxID=7111 RepID=A0A7E5VMV9_TRINI|nr:cytochrome P450 4C1-like [Trichoplusia ni]
MIGLILFCLLSCLCVLWAWTVYVKGKHKLPPLYPGALPIIGHIYMLFGDGTSLWSTVKAIAVETMKQGGVTTVILGSSIYYFITDPDDALTAANSCLQKHFAYKFAKPWLGEGLITSSGEVWKRHRKLLTPAFSLPVMLNFLDIFNSQSRKLVKNLKVEISKGPFDHTVYLRNIALETFCLTAFGISGFEDKEFIKTYMHAVDKILTIVTQRFQNFWLQSDLIFRLSGLKKEHDELIKIVNDMSNKVIQKKKAERTNDVNAYAVKASGVRYKPFLDLLLELSEENALTDKEIREEVDTAIVTGFDTSSSLLSYIMILLGTHPEVQDKIYDEISEVFQTDRDVDKDDLNKLVYTEAVIKESLRIFTTGPVTLRYVDKEVKLKNYTMRADTQCVVLLFGVHREAAWGKDVDKFRPERWLEKDMPANPNAFVGFSLGKRSCLGKTYAMISMKTTLAHFIRRYKVKADDSNLKLRFDFLLKPVSGHEITLEERV